MVGSRFETIAQARMIAERRLPRPVELMVRAGTGRGLTATDNVEAFDELGLAPRLLGTDWPPDTSASVMGEYARAPIVMAPTGGKAVHPDAEVAVARAAASHGLPVAVSMFATKPLADVVGANPNVSFQVYWLGGRDRMLDVLGRARDTGAKGLILTLDWPYYSGNDWSIMPAPKRLGLKEILQFAPDVLARPRWLAAFIRSGRMPTLSVPNAAARDGAPPTLLEALAELKATPTPTWADVEWLRQHWDGPLLVKGVTRAADAKRAVDAGATGLSVSNHGGNNLDGTPASIRALRAVVDACGSDVEILLDGGVRRGSDVVKALAMGARAVMVGRAYLWGLAVGGQAGVDRVLSILRSEMEATMFAIGRAKIADLSRSDLIIPASFWRDIDP
jgi:pre-mycofactocin synthase